MNRNKISKKKAVVTAMAGILAVGGIMGASAFFTDQAHTDAKAHMGGLNMTVEDLTDLDGDYSKWDIDQVAGTITEKDSVIDTAVAGATKTDDRLTGNFTGRVVANAIQTAEGDQTSENILNPGDSGLLQFKVSNVDSKSFRTAMKTSVVVQLAKDAQEPDGQTAATLQAAHKAGVEAGSVTVKYPDGTEIANQIKYVLADYDAYTIDGMGAPMVEFGAYSDGVFTKAEDGQEATATAMRLTYYTELDTLKGNVEDEATDGVKDSLIYAFETKFDRLAQNKFMGATIDIKSDFYALQNRKTAGTWYSVSAAAADDKGSNAVENTLNAATGDWTQIGSFEKVINVKDGVADASLNEDANTDVSGSVNGAVKGSATK